MEAIFVVGTLVIGSVILTLVIVVFQRRHRGAETRRISAGDASYRLRDRGSRSVDPVL